MPKKLCRQAGCSALIAYDAKYCAAHAKENSHVEMTRHYDKNIRNKSADKFYHSSQWKKLRTLQLTKQPLCVICFVPGEVVDHIEEISDGGCVTCMDNLQTLCLPCHNIKTKKVAKLRAEKKGGRV